MPARSRTPDLVATGMVMLKSAPTKTGIRYFCILLSQAGAGSTPLGPPSPQSGRRDTLWVYVLVAHEWLPTPCLAIYTEGVGQAVRP
eukprot:4468068-Pyramimonas_sp.AAC.1